MDIVRELTTLPHRGAATEQERRAGEILAGYLEHLGAVVERQPFRTPKTYIPVTWWLISGIVSGLLLVPVAPWLALILVAISAGLTLHYFDWRASPVSQLPPQGHSENIIGHVPSSDAGEAATTRGGSGKRLILMGHYDSAPVSMLYLPSMVKDFRRSLLVSLGLTAAAVVVAWLNVLGLGQPIVTWLRWLLIVYFLGQGILASIDYFRFGYTNGAADNATGAAVAMATAERLWRTPIPGWDIDAVLTGAEEANLMGSRAYYVANREELTPGQTYVLNFDNLGAGILKIIRRTGSVTNVEYSNSLVDAALETAAGDPRFADVASGVWHTGDFDSLWFARAGIPSLTLSAQDDLGMIPNLHRPTDTIANVDESLPLHAVDFAEATIRHLAEMEDGE
jgi:hypothetical protein